MNFALHRDWQSLAALTSGWNGLLGESATHAPFLRYEYLAAWWAGRGGGEWPDAELAVVTAEAAGRLVGVAPLFLARSRDGQPALLLLGSIEISDYLDLIARPDDLAAFIPALLDFLDRSGPAAWSALDWHNLPEASPTLPLLKAESERRAWAFSQERTHPSPSILLDGDFETYLARIDKKQRHEIRRKMRRADESGRSVRWYVVTEESSLDSEVEAFLGLMAQDPEKARFLSPGMRTQLKQICRAAFENGWLQLAFLEADGQRAAAYLSFDYANRIWVYNSGIDLRFMDLSAGWVLLGNLLKWASENGRAEFDFMRGREEYKYRFGAIDKFVVRARAARLR
jgi:CelD/BcsL family acetyltransferase involved in cellulose biosynthesis